MSVFLQGIQRKRPSEVQSAILRRHLLELTQSFIIPLVRKTCFFYFLFSKWVIASLAYEQKVTRRKGWGFSVSVVQPAAVFFQERYMASLMPLQRSVTPWKVSGQSWCVMMMSSSHSDPMCVCVCVCLDSTPDPSLQSR